MSEKSDKKSKDYKKYILPVSLSVLCLAIGFSFGILFQKHRLTSSFTARGGQFQMEANTGNRTGNRNNSSTTSTGTGAGNGTGLRDGSGNNSIFGEITKMDDSSITIKTTDGSSKIILLSDSTSINQSVTAAKTDLTVGTQVKVDGTTDSNTGSVTGKSIEINPSMVNQNNPPQQ